MTMNVAQAQSLFDQHSEADGMLPANYAPETALDIAKIRQGAGFTDAMDNFLAWQRKVKAAAEAEKSAPAKMSKAVQASDDPLFDPRFEKINDEGEIALIWNEVDLSTLSDEAQVTLDDYRAANKNAAESREKFEALLLAESPPAPKGRHTVPGYRFGKFTIAYGRGLSKKKTASTKARSLADIAAGFTK